MTLEFDGQLATLELACAIATFPLGSEKPRNYSSKMPSWYGQTAPNTSDSLEYYLRLSPDTLFFIFNHMALELQKPSKNYLDAKYLTWSQRHEEPKQTTADQRTDGYQ
ncbi:hypothetical protein GCK72_021343 [Caenorhabditis remanei]|uniref:Uncharacterized protein n=1 Tax=Caenorhabditis remanei TaxID=31234 RepID=A0A6A5GKB9_CAERE|nr:hypothetical protein GCK72_021343 [Caenorhabditis remanei]KAF1754779.1 hypothetical protein GCK72_021343 [Caenorhabditis remanei]